MLKVNSISKTYPPNSPALQNISFEVTSGQTLALLGLNGAGKTTLFKIITGLLVPDTGDIELSGKKLHDNISWCQKRIGFLPEHPPLYPELNTLEHLKLTAQLGGINVSKQDLEKTIERCDLQSVVKRPIGKLSKGFRQRIALGACLIINPPLLILDEPTVGLDPHQVDRFRQLIRDLSGERVILLSTHILSEVEATCNRCLILKEGQLVDDLSLPLKNEHLWEVTWSAEHWPEDLPALLDSENLEHQWMRSRLQLNETSKGELLIKNLYDKGVKIREFKRLETKLEDRFLKTTSS